jgi:hypothetical protein
MLDRECEESVGPDNFAQKESQTGYKSTKAPTPGEGERFDLSLLGIPDFRTKRSSLFPIPPVRNRLVRSPKVNYSQDPAQWNRDIVHGGRFADKGSASHN